MEEQRDIQQQYRQESSKYTYFLITIAVAAIGFSVQKTIDEPLLLTQIPLGIAVLAWACSVFSGFIYLQRGQDILFTNNAYFEALKGNLSDVGNNPAMKKVVANTLMNILEKKSERASKIYNWQFWLFLLGIILFVVWHLVEMAVRSGLL